MTRQLGEPIEKNVWSYNIVSAQCHDGSYCASWRIYDHSNGTVIMERVEVRRLTYIYTLRGSRVYGEIVVTVVVLVVAFIDFVEDISDLSYLSHVAAILFLKVRALAEEIV